jgi:hypothetical protein
MSLYQAVVNLSVPRKGDANKECDLVMAGETVELDDDTADLFRPPRRAMAMIRPAKESGDPLPRVHPKQLFGIAVNPRTGQVIGRPGPPQGARPDPPGSSTVQVLEPPEANEPAPGDETAGQGVPAEVDAEDIPPRAARAARAPARAGAR